MCGGAFFAVPYLGLTVGLLPSLAIGVSAFTASELLLKNKKIEEIQNTNKPLKEILLEAKQCNNKILEMESKIDSPKLSENIKELYGTIKNIVQTIEKKPEKYDSMRNFFDYYLPVTLNILTKYDEIENHNLSSNDSKKFMKQTEDMIEKINIAFKSQLDNLYQSSIVDTDAEMRVFESMLKADGYDTTSDFQIKREKEE